MILSLVILIIFNFIIKGALFAKIPNSISLEEIDNIKLVTTLPYDNPYLYRIISLIASSVIAALSFYIISKKTKNSTLGLFMGLVLTVSPWLFAASRAFNFNVLILFLVVLGYFVTRNRGFSFLAAAVILFFFVFFQKNFTLAPVTSLELFLKTLDLKTLFFSGDFLSSYLRIPKTGFFLFLDLLPLPVGLYYIFTKENMRYAKASFLWFLAIGAYYFLITSSDLILQYRGLYIFYALSIPIATGYYFLFKFLANKNVFLPFLGAFAIAANVFFYHELFFLHFDKKNSVEWGYAEERVAKIIDSSGIEKVYVFPESGRFIPYLSLFANRASINIVLIKEPERFNQHLCLSKKTVCVLKEHELKIINKEKDEIKTKVTYVNQIPAYYLFSQESLEEI